MTTQSDTEAADLLERLSRLERALEDQQTELCTRRLVVVDDAGAERVVLETVDEVAEVRVLVPGTDVGKSCMATLFAVAASAESAPGVGLQAMVDGDSVIELAAWRAESHGWDVNLHIE